MSDSTQQPHYSPKWDVRDPKLDTDHAQDPMQQLRPTPALDEFITNLEGELRTGGGATLDELMNLAEAIREDLQHGR